jgi:hypothetical protein
MEVRITDGETGRARARRLSSLIVRMWPTVRARRWGRTFHTPRVTHQRLVASEARTYG